MNEQKKRAVSAEGEGPATAETTYPLIVPSHLLQVREAWNHQYEGSLKREQGGQGFRKSLPPLPGQYRWEGDRHNPPLLMYVHLCFRVGPPPLLLIRLFSNPDFQILAIPGPALCVVMYMFRLAGHYRSSGMARRRGEASTSLRRLD